MGIREGVPTHMASHVPHPAQSAPIALGHRNRASLQEMPLPPCQDWSVRDKVTGRWWGSHTQHGQGDFQPQEHQAQLAGLLYLM